MTRAEGRAEPEANRAASGRAAPAKLPAVVVAGVSKTFRPPASVRLLLGGRLRGRPVVALEGIDLGVPRGQALGLMGGNGAGKSTLLRILAGLLLPSSGRVSVCGLDATRGGPELARKVGYVAADERGLTPQLTPREQLAFAAALHGYRRRAALALTAGLLERFGIDAWADRPLRELSTGLKRRTALARAFVGAPEVLLLDEPTRGVDPAGTHALHEHLRAAMAAGLTVVVATHHADEARALCHEVAVLERSRLVALSAPDAALDRLVAHG